MGHIVQFRVMNLHQRPFIKLAAKARHFAAVNSLVEIEPPKETSVGSRRNRTYKYKMKDSAYVQICSCQHLELEKKSVYVWVESSTSGLPEKKKDSGKHNSTIN